MLTLIGMRNGRTALTLGFTVHISIEWPANLFPESLTIEAPAAWLVLVLLMLWIWFGRDRQ